MRGEPEENNTQEVIIMGKPNEEKKEEVGSLDFLGNILRGFPGGCPLPDELKNEILGLRTRRRHACRVCIDLGSRTEGYRKDCPHWKGMLKAYRKKSLHSQSEFQ